MINVVLFSVQLSFDSLAKYGRVFGDNAPILSALQVCLVAHNN